MTSIVALLTWQCQDLEMNEDPIAGAFYQQQKDGSSLALQRLQWDERQGASSCSKSNHKNLGCQKIADNLIPVKAQLLGYFQSSSVHIFQPLGSCEKHQ